jgi:hypothetical protein
MQGLKSVLVQALVSELAVEALDISVLHWSPPLDQDMPDAVCLRPSHERATGELRPVVGANGQRVVDALRHSSFTGMPASAWRMNPMICSSVNLLFFMSVILLVGGLR